VISLSEFWKVLSTSNSAHSCYGTGAAGCAQVEILTPNAPKDANQNNSNLIRYVGGKPFDASGKPLELKN
jgi:filamentous hemagglutinin